MDPWSALHKKKNDTRKPLYICLSGNSGVGKSTLLRKLSVYLYRDDHDTIALDEKAVHHHLLPYLFDDTAHFGYLIQLNFMIQRSLLIKSWLAKGFNLVMERSHLEDYIFINFMFKAGYITESQHKSYMSLWYELNEITPIPDLIVFLDFDTEQSLKNLQQDELSGIRPQEFPNNVVKNKWITGWHSEYLHFTQNLPPLLQQRVFTCTSPGTVESLSDKVIEKIHDIRRLHASEDHSLSTY
ncbi:deoxynucleoside kinase [Acerihabitans arboris]|nr:deoxynucleoside kinase [Acerihabitans arboris]